MKNKVLFYIMFFSIFFVSITFILTIYTTINRVNKPHTTLRATKMTSKRSTTTSSKSDKQSIQKFEYAGIKYWLYEPNDIKSDLPMIIYLHNSKVSGDNLDKVLNNGLPKLLASNEIEVAGFVLIPQLESKYQRWSKIDDRLIKLIDEVVKKHNIDAGNVSLTGHSIGGRATFELAIKYPNYFSKIAPVSANVEITDKNIEALKDIPTWAFVGTNDTVVKPSISKDFVNKLSLINTNTKITEIEGATHLSILDSVYKNQELINWLLTK